MRSLSPFVFQHPRRTSHRPTHPGGSYDETVLGDVCCDDCLLPHDSPRSFHHLGGTAGVYPDDPSTWLNTTTGYIGYTSNGTLTADGGSNLLSNCGYIGYAGSVTGLVTVSGVGSTWNNGSSSSGYSYVGLYVGYSGVGTLNITDGASVSNYSGHSNGDTYVGSNIGSTGSVTVSGAGSNWTNANLYVGGSGSGTLSVLGGGSVSISAATSATIAIRQARLRFQAPDQKWTNGSLLYVGGFGNGSLSIMAGGTSSSVGSYSYIGVFNGSTGSVTVSGPDQRGPIRAFCHGRRLRKRNAKHYQRRERFRRSYNLCRV